MPDADPLSMILPGDVILVSYLGFSPIKIANFCKDGYTKRIWTHAALYIGNGQIVESVVSGVRIINLQDAYPDDGKNALKILRRKHLNPEAVPSIVAFCKGQVGHHYDYFALVYFVFFYVLPTYWQFILMPQYLGRWLNRPGAYFCSELVSEGFERADVYCFERESFQIMPIDFYNPLLFDEVATRPFPEAKPAGWFKRTLLQFAYAMAIPVAIILLVLTICTVLIGVFWLFHSLVFKKEKQAAARNLN